MDLDPSKTHMILIQISTFKSHTIMDLYPSKAYPSSSFFFSSSSPLSVLEFSQSSTETPNSSNVSSYTYNSNSSSCVKSSVSLSDSATFDQVLHNELYSVYDKFYLGSPHVLKDLIWTLIVTLIFSVPFGLAILLLLKHYTKQIVYAALPFFIVMPIFFNVYWFIAHAVSSTCSDAFLLVYRILLLVFVFLIFGVIVWIFVVNWHRIELTVSIIGVVSDALSRNLRLFGVMELVQCFFNQRSLRDGSEIHRKFL